MRPATETKKAWENEATSTCKQAKGFSARDFVVWEAAKGEMLFRVPAGRDGSVPIERIAGMLAMHCLASNRRLEDFEVLVLPRTALITVIAERADYLIAVGRSIRGGTELSGREREVLEGVVQNLSNKEIARKLNISVFTVKANVSSLLAKFKVSNRIALAKQFSDPFHGAPPSISLRARRQLVLNENNRESLSD